MSHFPHRNRLAITAIIALACTLPLQTFRAADVVPASAPDSIPAAKEREKADVPAIRRDKEGNPMAIFTQRHEAFLARAKEGPIGLLFIGDSITAGWARADAMPIWKQHYGDVAAANFGIGGDRTQNVLWRIEHGELDGISPAVVVLLIGVNNGRDKDISNGIRKIVDGIHTRLPDTKVLLLGIFPHGSTPTETPWTTAARTHITEINKELAKLDDGKKTRFLDIGARFLQPDGSISKEVMPDGLHPAGPGYQIWADAMQPLLTEMLSGTKS